MNVDVHLLSFNEAEILPYTLRHYQRFASRILVHDGRSTDGTREVIAQTGATLVDWDTQGMLNDALARELKNTCWHGTDADWVIAADADELIYFPSGAEETLGLYELAEVAIAKPHGWEMCSDVFPNGDGQIYDYVKLGASDERWYSKPILFSPRRVARLSFTSGAHTVTGWTKDGREIPNPVNFSFPETYLLHFKHVGPVERIAKRYDEVQARLSPVNRKHRWGNFEPGMKHALDKREMIMAHITQVIP